ncbi:MAG: insulinase family protein [Prevotellaceae bacterium]|jgi:zinc protease|nr:insulinase family protein [Prevotellaceae bacterium]
MNKTFILAVICLFTTGLTAQNQQLPVDSAIRKGTLPNGLTYYIRHNEQPKQRAEFHIAQNVGAILEMDDQNGLAHFLEHMAFNGTEHFPDKLIINYFESIGVNFGGNINAYTSLDETVYRLSDVPTIRESIVDTALLVLYDWSCALTLADEEIDAERGVILEEWRTRADANRRMWKSANAQKYAGSQYAKRDVIGDTAVIKHFEYDALRRYYKKWYGPDLQAIVVVGDIDTDKVEAKIKELWGKVPERANRGERPVYYLPDNHTPIVSIVTDKEAQGGRITLEYKHKTPPEEVKLSSLGYIQMLKNQLTGQIFSYRLDELSMKPDASFMGAYVGYSNLTKGNDAFMAIIVPKEGKEKAAFKDLLTELEKAQRFGFTQSELERAKTDILNDFEKSYNERNNRQNIGLAREYIRNFLEAECIPGIEWEYETAKNIFPQITKNMLNELFNSYLTDENLIIAFQAPEKEEIKLPTKEEAISMLKEVERLELQAPKEEVIAQNLVDKKPKAGKIQKITKSISLGTTEWILSNGVRVIIKPTEFKQDEILFRAFSWGGLNTVTTEDLPSAEVASSVVSYSGLGKYSHLDLQKILTGKTVSCSTDLTDERETFSGNSSVKDFELLLQLVYLNFTSIRKDDEAFNTMIDLFKNSIVNREKKPSNIFSDTLSADWTCHSPRNLIYNMDFVSKIDNQKALDIYKQRFNAANDFTYIFTGNINPNDKKTQKLICTWLGGLKAGNIEKYTRLDECHPDGYTKNHFTKKMETDNSTNAIRYYAPMEWNWENDINLRVLGRVLDIRYLESIREKEGGSYGVGVSGYMNILPDNEGILSIRFDCNPDKQARLLEIVHQEINEILLNGTKAEDLNKVKESLLKDYAENVEKNSWWSGSLVTYYMWDRNAYNDYQNEVQKVTSETVQKTLKKLVEAGNILEVVMNPEK